VILEGNRNHQLQHARGTGRTLHTRPERLGRRRGPHPHPGPAARAGPRTWDQSRSARAEQSRGARRAARGRAGARPVAGAGAVRGARGATTILSSFTASIDRAINVQSFPHPPSRPDSLTISSQLPRVQLEACQAKSWCLQGSPRSSGCQAGCLEPRGAVRRGARTGVVPRGQTANHQEEGSSKYVTVLLGLLISYS